MKTLKKLTWNAVAIVSTLALGFVVTCGFASVGMPAVLAGLIGAGVYIGTLLQIVR